VTKHGKHTNSTQSESQDGMQNNAELEVKPVIEASSSPSAKHASQTSAQRAKRTLAGVGIGVGLTAALIGGLFVALPAQSEVDTSQSYGYTYSGAKSRSVAFNTAQATDTSMLVFGSSELSTPAKTVPQVPTVVFGTRTTDLDLIYVGEAYNQSLWQAMAAAAYEPSVTNKKVVLIVSPTWFEDDGLDNDTFKLRFSYQLYRAFCENPKVSESSRNYLATRLAEQGIDTMTIQAGQRKGLTGYLNDAVLNAIEDMQIRNDLRDVRTRGISQTDASSDALQTTSDIDFDELYEEAITDAEEACTTNDWGMDDAFYEKNIEGKLERLTGTQVDETFSYEKEYNDLSFFLKVCSEVGLEPLVVISPVHGEFYDLVGTTAENRQQCYSRIKQICEAHEVDYADFSSKEYENYFLHDIVHFGWTGWVAVEEAIVNYANTQ
jgi:D-alanine transfer protein